MKVCQIATIGENIEWIFKGLLLCQANKLILVSTNELRFKEKVKEIKKRLLDSQFEVNPLEIEEKIVEGHNILDFIKILKDTILENTIQGYSIEINATAGLTMWQILGYFTAMQLENVVHKFFIINKQKGEALILPLGTLSKTEQLIIDIIKNGSLSIEDIKKAYENLKSKKVSVALISKYLVKLKDRGLVSESKIERFKYFDLTSLGKMYNLNLDFQELTKDRI